jgi:uracil-DNA glycosylase family 4
MGKEEELARIAREIAGCAECRRGKSGLPVPGEGNPDAEIMLIGEAPGRREAESGRPFVGRSGKLLTRMLEQAGIRREDLFITSPVKFYPGPRAPTRKEIEHGRTHLEEQIDAIRPMLIVLMGRTAMEALLPGSGMKVTLDHGRPVDAGGRRYFITFHPAAALRGTRTRRMMESDLSVLEKGLRRSDG